MFSLSINLASVFCPRRPGCTSSGQGFLNDVLLVSTIYGRAHLEPPSSALCVLSHHLKCEMKSPHLGDFSRDFVDFLSSLGRLLADF